MRGKVSLLLAVLLWVSGLVVVPFQYGIEKPFSIYCLLCMMVGSLFAAYGIDGVFSDGSWANKAFVFCLGMVASFAVALVWFGILN